jgi:hypothetical protein
MKIIENSRCPVCNESKNTRMTTYYNSIGKKAKFNCMSCGLIANDGDTFTITKSENGVSVVLEPRIDT